MKKCSLVAAFLLLFVFAGRGGKILTTEITYDSFENPNSTGYQEHTLCYPEGTTEANAEIVYKVKAKLPDGFIGFAKALNAGIIVAKNDDYRLKSVTLDWNPNDNNPGTDMDLYSTTKPFESSDDFKNMGKDGKLAKTFVKGKTTSWTNIEDEIMYFSLSSNYNAQEFTKITIEWEKMGADATPVKILWKVNDMEVDGNKYNGVYSKEARWIEFETEPAEAESSVVLDVIENNSNVERSGVPNAVLENAGHYEIKAKIKGDVDYEITENAELIVDIAPLQYELNVTSEYGNLHSAEFNSEEFNTHLLLNPELKNSEESEALDMGNDLTVLVEKAEGVEFLEVGDSLMEGDDLGYDAQSSGRIIENELLLDIACSGLYKVTVSAANSNVVGQDKVFNINVYPSIAGLKIGEISLDRDTQQATYVFYYEEENPENIINAKAPVSVPVYGAELWYKLHTGSSTKGLRQANEVVAEIDDYGYTKAENGEIDLSPIIDTTGSSISFVLKKNGATTPINTMEEDNKSLHNILISTSKNVSTDVDEIIVERSERAEYYNLQGQKITMPERGIFIKVKDGKAEKVKI